MRKLAIVDMDETKAKSITLKEAIYGLRIGATSELAACYVTIGQSPQYASVREPDNYHHMAAGDVHMVPRDNLLGPDGFKVSVERPLIGRLGPGELKIHAFTPVEYEGGVTRKAILELEILENRDEIMWAPTKRAPAEIDASARPLNTAPGYMLLPMFGRVYVTLEIDVVVGGADTITWQLDGIRRVIRGSGGGGGAIANHVTPLIASRADAASVQVAYEGEVEFDFLRFTMQGAIAPAGSFLHIHGRAID